MKRQQREPQGAMDAMAGVQPRRKKLKLTAVPRVLFRGFEAAAMMTINEGLFRQLVTSGVVVPVLVPSSVPGKWVRRYTREAIEAAARELMERR